MESIMTNQPIVIETANELAAYESITRRRIVDMQSYEYYLKTTTRVFKELEADHNLEHRPYQYENAAVMCCRRRNIMGYDMAVGKTICSLLALSALYPDLSRMRRAGIHISVPSLLASNRWVEDLGKFRALKELFTVVNSEGALLACTTPIIIYTHDFPKRTSKTNNPRRPVMSRLMGKFKPIMMIIDEVHGIKGPSDRREHLEYLARKSVRVLGLSGTLSDGNLAQLYTVCHFIYGKYWPYASAATFSKLFGSKEQLQTNFLYGSTKTDLSAKFLQGLDITKLPDFYAICKRFIHRVRLDEPQVEPFITIPEQRYHIHKLMPTQNQKDKHASYLQQYESRLQAIAAGTGNYNADALSLCFPLIELANGVKEYTNKLTKVLELCKASTGKVLIFYTYVSSGRNLHQFLQYNLPANEVVRLYSKDEESKKQSLSHKERQDVVDKFQYDPKVKYGIFSINLAAESIDLTAASTVIIYCIPWSSLKLQQALARAARPGNKNKFVDTHLLYQVGLIDEHQVTLALQKLANSKRLMDYEPATGDETDLSPAAIVRKLITE